MCLNPPFPESPSALGSVQLLAPTRLLRGRPDTRLVSFSCGILFSRLDSGGCCQSAVFQPTFCCCGSWGPQEPQPQQPLLLEVLGPGWVFSQPPASRPSVHFTPHPQQVMSLWTAKVICGTSSYFGMEISFKLQGNSPGGPLLCGEGPSPGRWAPRPSLYFLSTTSSLCWRWLPVMPFRTFQDLPGENQVCVLMLCTVQRKLFGEDPALWRGGTGTGDKDRILWELSKTPHLLLVSWVFQTLLFCL